MICDMKVYSKVTFGLLICLLAFLILGMEASSNSIKAINKTKFKGTSGYDVITAVNQVRAANGLSAYQIDGSLMASAQAHSEYQASIGSITHTGRGGSDVKSRAIAAGYGGGAAVSIIENIFGGTNATAQQAVNNWQGDSLHLNTLLSSKATDAGAGVATDGSLVYYTLDVGYIVGSEGNGGLAAAGSSAAPATSIAFFPIQISTPNTDGSIIHVVRPGQTLWSIAATYKIDLSKLLNLNGFTNSTFIFPGQRITIKSSGAIPGKTSEQTGSPDATTAIQEPMDTASPIPATEIAILEVDKTERLVEVKDATISPFPMNPYIPNQGNEPLLWVIAVFVLGGTALIVVGGVLKRRR
jgi:LysM repeat protein